ncbi:MAG: excinuclease ABC subunit UvrA [Planctomycetota bacterium]|jgi:excinuclease ABC subunit A|nr:excinuclease ABC subunit UvrA [Planctomycetota bacterium]
MPKARRSPPAAVAELPVIQVRGAAEHNLKQVDLDIPKKRLVVFTGPSGSGKSSLAFDTIYAEGQRRYVESLSAYARQFLGQMEKPHYESIRGLAPTIAIEQKSASKNPRSTVGTITEVHDYLRVLWARCGTQHCHHCGAAVGKRSSEEIVDAILNLPQGSRLLVLAPKISARKGEYQDLFDRLRKGGFARVRIDGEERSLDDSIALNKKLKHSIEVVVDRLVVKDGIRSRLADSVETALREGEGKLMVAPHVRGTEKPPFAETFFSEHLYCATCDLSFPDLEPNSFSFNSPMGFCPSCNGLGTRAEVDVDKLIPEPSLSINDGAVLPWGALGDEERTAWHVEYRREVLRKLGVPCDKPWGKLSEKQRHIVLNGADKRVKVNWTTTNGEGAFNTRFDGVLGWLDRTLKETASEGRKARLARYFSTHNCSDCGGGRLRPESRSAQVGKRSLVEVAGMTIGEAQQFFDALKLNTAQRTIAEGVLREVQSRLRFLINVGLDYLTLDRSGPTLSGGEAQRIRLASQIGSELTGVLYVLDEPSIGLHQRDNRRLIETLQHLRDIGNSVLVVEHDEETIRAADFVVDFGPLAGELGGEIVYAGEVDGLIRKEGVITGDYLSGRKAITTPSTRRAGKGTAITVRGARANNLKNIDVSLPLGRFVCLTGVSGAGKSSLLNQILYPALGNHFNGADNTVGAHDGIDGLEHIDSVIAIDQQPIGRTPRSNPATYVKAWDEVRKIFSQTREAKLYGYSPSRFSFNVKGGRCEACEGDGVKKVEMHFLADVYVPCEVCHGKRFNEQTLRVHYKGNTIHDVLAMSVREAKICFDAHPRLSRILQTLIDVGLDYIRLGQPATTLSGGEAQRIKLSRELAKRSTGDTLYILDEPSTGLHFEDVRKLLDVLARLTDAGNTVVVIEHNLDIIKTADHIIDLGPEGGERGGTVVATGTPEQVAAVKASYTGQFLAEMFARTGNSAKPAATAPRSKKPAAPKAMTPKAAAKKSAAKKASSKKVAAKKSSKTKG